MSISTVNKPESFCFSSKTNANTSQDNLSNELTWKVLPKNVLVIKKNTDAMLRAYASLVKYLIESQQLTVFIESNEFDNQLLDQDKQLAEFKLKLGLKRFEANANEEIDLVICLGA